MFDLYRSAAVLSCFDNEDGDAESASTGDQDGRESEGGAGGPEEGGTSGTDEEVTKFTQDDVNKFLAEQKRKWRAQQEELEKKLAALSESKSLSDEERASLESALETTRAQLRTKEEQAKIDKRKMEEEHKRLLAEASEKAQVWEDRYRSSTIERALTDAAVGGEAFNPSQVVTLLKGQTQLMEDDNDGFKVLVEMMGEDEAGEATKLMLTPKEAVKRMQDLPETFGNLFRSNVVGGVGGNSATGGLASGQTGQIDLRSLTPEQYRTLRKENPAALGLQTA